MSGALGPGVRGPVPPCAALGCPGVLTWFTFLKRPLVRTPRAGVETEHLRIPGVCHRSSGDGHFVEGRQAQREGGTSPMAGERASPERPAPPSVARAPAQEVGASAWHHPRDLASWTMLLRCGRGTPRPCARRGRPPLSSHSVLQRHQLWAKCLATLRWGRGS